MNTRPAIHKITYRRGMVTNLSDWHGLQTSVPEGPNLTKEIVDAVLDNELLAANGVYGIPDAGDPIEVDSLQINHQLGITEITLYNRGIMLFTTDDELLKRIHKACCIIENQVKLRKPAKNRTNELIPITPVQPVNQVKAIPAKKSQEPVYQIKIGLLEIDPTIWRRFIVPSGVTLHRLHLILQAVMGWTNSHLYKFQIREKEYAEPNPDNELYELPFKNSKRAKLGQLVTKKGSTLFYEYDFGDGWDHLLILEDIMEREPDKRYPICLSGERRCPPEDCGGVHGYERMLEIISDREHEEYLDTMTWLGGHFDPDGFDIEAVNQRLFSMRLR